MWAAISVRRPRGEASPVLSNKLHRQAGAAKGFKESRIPRAAAYPSSAARPSLIHIACAIWMGITVLSSQCSAHGGLPKVWRRFCETAIGEECSSGRTLSRYRGLPMLPRPKKKAKAQRLERGL